ncbi:RNI-like protein [Wallemia mellicola CBS 633.66]|uniref:RNI-like protein n=1 Tax=Wallemia mellicola (strain ATCC MYA-4683 / CBS 633.66) TaxID=671144 RepID=I4YBR1_WALMC|nr:RNI-like protein [Wallemia mellicola CBS 633.66]EIM21403.1 RNI-like protein [Wallemia mellicola CBS 633.66]|eukprot:XP_006958435.1 RNI-like protein [Wallemia mellicola CBS 633.66]
MVRNNTNNTVRGPTSALTSFLREQGITGPAGYPYRRLDQPANNQTTPANASTSQTPLPQDQSSDSEDLDRDDDIEPSSKRLKVQTQIDQEEDPYTAPSRAESTSSGGIGSKTACIECQSKVIITKYTPPGPDGIGVLCPKCTTALGIDPFKQDQPKRKKAPKREKRNVPSIELPKKPKSLSDYAIKVIIDNIDHVESLNEIGINALETIAKIISKNRSLNPRTLQLFLGSHQESLSLYDAANLDTECLKSIAVLCPHLKNLTIHFAGQLSGDVIKAWTSKFKNLTSLDIHGAYLVKPNDWVAMIKKFGSSLTSFKVSHCSKFDESCVEALGNTCANLESLSLSQIMMYNQGIDHLCKLEKIKQLEIIEINGEVTSEAIVNLLKYIGGGIELLTLSKNPDLDDETLSVGIKLHCPNIRQLNLSDCESFENDGFKSLFNDWNAENLNVLDISKDYTIVDDGIEAIVDNVGKNIEVFGMNKLKNVTRNQLISISTKMPKLKEIDISWCSQTDDSVIKSFMENCQHLKQIKCFGCLLLTRFCPQKSGVQIIGCPALLML